MSTQQEQFYNLMIVGIPILLSILAFIGALAVNALIKMGKDINEIKVTVKEVMVKHDDLKDRVSRLEEKIFA